MIDRRDFLLAAGAATVGMAPSAAIAALPSDTFASAPFIAGGVTRRQFSEHLNAEFEFSQLDGLHGTRAELIAIEDRGTGSEIEQFELLFRAPPGGELPEGVFAMKGPSGARSAHLVQPAAGMGKERKFAVHFSLLN